MYNKNNQFGGFIYEKILSMNAKGMTVGDIGNHLNNLYVIEISDSTISRVTEVMAALRELLQK